MQSVPCLDNTYSFSTNDNCRVCRICLEKDDKSKLIAPCRCKGSIKYVHSHCLAAWRTSLALNNGRHDLYRCTLCREKFRIRHRRRWASLFSQKVTRVVATAILFLLFLIPAGTLMKMLLHFSAQLIDYPGGWKDAWSSGAWPSLLLCATHNAIRHSLSNSTSSLGSANIDNRIILYAPFPFCLSSCGDNHSLVSSSLIYYILFPLADERLWQFVLCRLEHLHLGLFLIGSIRKVYFTYTMLNDMLTTQQEQQDAWMLNDDDDDDDNDDANDGNHEHEFMRAVVVLAAAAGNNDTMVDTITRVLGKIIRGFLLVYCCLLAILVWIHFYLFAFYVVPEQAYASKRFSAELPLWTFRWITITVAAADFVIRDIYSWLDRIITRIDDEEIISLA
ncbi:hypothetical protein BX666DRAFT_1971569 [Dichotomocladium elegans]|nr:hypothetical protein BX666DRAFT_1971569 [Dichotomocladium elegans]